MLEKWWYMVVSYSLKSRLPHLARASREHGTFTRVVDDPPALSWRSAQTEFLVIERGRMNSSCLVSYCGSLQTVATISTSARLGEGLRTGRG